MANCAGGSLSELHAEGQLSKRHATESSIYASLKFLEWQSLYDVERPFQIFINIPEQVKDRRTTNLVFEDRLVMVKDIRGGADNYSLDDYGFMYRKHETKTLDFEDRAMVENQYLPEVESLLRCEVSGVDRVFFFDWRLRKNAPELEGAVIDLNDPTEWLRPAMHVHIDQSAAAVLNRIRLQLATEAPHLLRGRVRVLNVWRPLVDCVDDWPLAIGDGSTFASSDLVETDHVRRHYTGSTMYVKHNDRQQFYFMSKQSHRDVLIFKNFDSDKTKKARCCPTPSTLYGIHSDDEQLHRTPRFNIRKFLRALHRDRASK